MKTLIFAMLLFGCATIEPLYFGYEYAGEPLNTKVVKCLEERPTLNYYRYYVVAEGFNNNRGFDVVTNYPIPEGVNVYLAFDSVEVNSTPRGSIDKVRYLYKK